MPDVAIKPRTKVRLKPERPRLHKVILLNDDYTPREFVVTVLKAEFRMNEDQAYRVMMTVSARRMRGRRLYPRRRRDQGHARNGSRPPQGLSAAIYHRARRIKYLPRWRAAVSALRQGSARYMPVFSKR